MILANVLVSLLWHRAHAKNDTTDFLGADHWEPESDDGDVGEASSYYDPEDGYDPEDANLPPVFTEEEERVLRLVDKINELEAKYGEENLKAMDKDALRALLEEPLEESEDNELLAPVANGTDALAFGEGGSGAYEKSLTEAELAFEEQAMLEEESQLGEAPDEEAEGGEMEGERRRIATCEAQKAANIGAFTSATAMVQQGWKIDVSHGDMTHSGVKAQCGKGAGYFGWSGWNDEGTLRSPVLKGTGTVRAVYGNCWDAGVVRVYHNGVLKGSAPKKQFRTVTIDYKDGDTISFKDEDGNSVIQIKSFVITSCSGCTTWSPRLEGKYILQQHGASNECYEFEEAKRRCEAAGDCHGIATQSNVCGGKYRVTHGSTATLKHYGHWARYNLWAYTLDRTCLSSTPSTPSTDSDPTEPGCYVKTPQGCPRDRDFNAKTWMRDYWGEENAGAGRDRNACLNRKRSYDSKCGETVQMKFIEGKCNVSDYPRLAGGYRCKGSCMNGNKHYYTLESAWEACGKIAECARVVFELDHKFRLRRKDDIRTYGQWNQGTWNTWGYTNMYHVEYPWSCRASEKQKTCGEFMVEEVDAIEYYTGNESCPDNEGKGERPCGDRSLSQGGYCQGDWQCGPRKQRGGCNFETYKIVGTNQYVLNERNCPVTDNQKFYTTAKNWIAMTGQYGRPGEHIKLEQYSSEGNKLWTGYVKVIEKGYEIIGEVVGSRGNFKRFNKGDMLSVDMDLNPWSKRRMEQDGIFKRFQDVEQLGEEEA